jgi:hypothetical protein
MNILLNSLGILSLSKNYNSILMWSHYGNSHTGLVFEFTPRNLKKEDSYFFPLIEVDYVDKYEYLSYINHDHGQEITKLVLTKFKDWAYEEEYRCFGLDFCRQQRKFHKDELTGIIFGAKASQVDIENTIGLCLHHDYHHIHFKQAKLQRGNFTLNFEDISI